MMTRGEAIALLNEQYEICKRIYDCSADQRKSYPNIPQFMEALGMALTALRPVSREQVEKVFPGCGMCSGWNKVKLKPCANGDLGVQADIGSVGKGDAFGLVVYNNHLASGYVDFPFCPFCGKPQTDEAVEMVMELGGRRRWTVSKHDCEACIHKVVCALWEIQNELCDNECAYYQPTLTPPNEWVSVENALPPEHEPVLCIVSGKPNPNITLEDAYQLGSWNKADGWIIDEWLDWEGANVTWWMKLPVPPDRRPPEGEANETK